MKRVIYLLISLLLINYSNISGKGLITETISSPGDTIRVFSTPDLYHLTVKWADEYRILYPDINIKVSDVSDNDLTGKLFEGGHIGFISNERFSGFNDESLWKVVVGRDIIVPVINSKNPFFNEIFQKGISPETFAGFFNNKDSQTWGTLLKSNDNSNVSFYRINDESIRKGLAGFLKTDMIYSSGIEVKNAEEMISAIQKDPYAMGFCKMISILDFNSQRIVDNISLLPIDRNGNGIIDYSEKIYDNLNAFSRGVWIGKYPKTLFSNIYSVSSDQPQNVNEKAFLKWVVTDGQKILNNTGYSELLVTERQSTVDKLYEANVKISATPSGKSVLLPLLFIITGIILAGLILDTIARARRRKKDAAEVTSAVPHPVLNENSLIIPAGLYFDKTHTWAFMEQNGVVKVGIDDFLQHITGTITRVKMKNPGEKVKKGDLILSLVQNGKQLNLYAPISGVIKEQNQKLETNSSIINSSPYNDGWIYKIEPTNWVRENQLLFMAEKQKQFIKNEFSRLKDFLSVVFTADTEKYAMVILQDGGELRDGILSNLGPEVWEEFQTKFIDTSRQLWFYEIF
jgi:glycine cleavage system H lipoate-binding protein/ABC-type phosphate transport system substrate-binding protein